MKGARLCTIAICITCISSFGQVFEVDTLHFNGDIDHLINLVILGDGYQEHELPQYLIDARNFTDNFFLERPFQEYQQYFNVFAIKVPSNESGASHPGTATDVDEPAHPVIVVDNYFGSSFDNYEVHRALVANNEVAIINVLASNFPSYDQALILVNTPYAGGTGGRFPTASQDILATEAALHEIGHSLVGLADEYWAGDIFAGEYLNMTAETDPSLVRWTNWMDDFGIGIYQYCCGETSANWNKPHEECKMQYLGVPFCAVCVEGTIERIHTMTNPIISYSPADMSLSTKSAFTDFRIELVEPLPNTLKKTWLLNEEELDHNADSILYSALELQIGKNTLTVLVEDSTSLLRVNGHENLHVASVTWYIDQTAIHVDVDKTICQGDSVFLQGAYQSMEGIYADTILVTGGADTVFTTTLAVETVDVSVSQLDNTLTANLEGALYQWIDCKGHVPITDAVYQSFTPADNGEFAVEIIFNGCKDTTECYTVTTIGIPENNLKSTFKAYPNPTNGNLFISFENGDHSHMIRIISSDGRTVYFKNMSAPEIQIDMSDMGSEGLYYLQLIGEEGEVLAVRKIVRK